MLDISPSNDMTKASVGSLSIFIWWDSSLINCHSGRFDINNIRWNRKGVRWLYDGLLKFLN
jgi:hypothetical protein